MIFLLFTSVLLADYSILVPQTKMVPQANCCIHDL